MGPGLEPSCPTSHTSQSGDGGQGATELAIPAGTWSLVGRQERAGRKEDQTRTYKHELHWGSGGGGGVGVGVSLPSGSQTRQPARSAAPAAPLGEARRTRSLSRRGSCPASARHPAWLAGWLAGLLPLGSRSISSSSSSSPSSISSGLACCASSASSSREASLLGRGRGLRCSAGPSSPPAPPLRKESWLAPSSRACPHLTNRILLWAREGWSRSASAASCSARCSNSFMSSMPLCPGARSDTAGRAGMKRGGQTLGCPQPSVPTLLWVSGHPQSGPREWEAEWTLALPDQEASARSQLLTGARGAA